MSLVHRSRTAALAAALTLAASTFLTVFAVSPAQAAVTVSGSGFGASAHWSPVTTTLARGGAVRWRATLYAHRVKAYGGNWTYARLLTQGASTAPRTFARRGTFRFFCSIHGSVIGGVCSGMCGKIVVH